MELFDNLLMGLSTALQLNNLLFCLIGVVIGTAIGVLPGIGPIATIAMLLPLTFHLEPVSGLIMLAGIFYGAQYGGSTTAILIASLATREARPIETLLFALGLSAAAVLLFVKALALPVPIWPGAWF